MTSLMTTSLILFSCWVMIIKCRAGDSILDFCDVFNGRYNNFDQNSNGEGSKNKVEGIFKPVLVTSLQKEPMIYAEESVDGNVVRMLVGIVTENANGNIMKISFLNFTIPSQNKPGSFNTDDLDKLPSTAFQAHEGCEAEFKKISDGKYEGFWPDCTHFNKKRQPGYTLVLTCKEIFGTSSVLSLESTGRLPTDLKLIGRKFPLLGAPSGYVSPCKDDH